jgi:hypothetical protein
VAPETIAFGVRPPGEDGVRDEVLCAIDLPSGPETPGRAEAMEAAFAPHTVDPLTDEVMSEEVAHAEIDTYGGADGAEVTRAVLERPPGAEPGLLLEAFPRGSVLLYLGASRPVPQD